MSDLFALPFEEPEPGPEPDPPAPPVAPVRRVLSVTALTSSLREREKW